MFLKVASPAQKRWGFPTAVMNSPLIALPPRLSTQQVSRRPWFLRVPVVAMKASFKAQVLGSNSVFMELLTLWLMPGEPNNLGDFAADILLMEGGLLPWPPEKEGAPTETDIEHKIKNAFSCTDLEAEMLMKQLPVDVDLKDSVSQSGRAMSPAPEGNHFSGHLCGCKILYIALKCRFRYGRCFQFGFLEWQ